jgi:hypothetical protein
MALIKILVSLKNELPTAKLLVMNCFSNSNVRNFRVDSDL